MANITSHEGRFSLFGPNKIPLIGYTLEGLKETASENGGQIEIEGSFTRSDRLGQKVDYMILYSQKNAGEISCFGVTFEWTALPVNPATNEAEPFYLAIISGYRVPDKILVDRQKFQEVQPVNSHYYIVAATESRPDPQGAGENHHAQAEAQALGSWETTKLTIEPSVLYSASTEEYTSMYFAQANDSHHQDPEILEVVDISLPRGKNFVVSGQNRLLQSFPSGMYIFGKPSDFIGKNHKLGVATGRNGNPLNGHNGVGKNKTDQKQRKKVLDLLNTGVNTMQEAIGLLRDGN